MKRHQCKDHGWGGTQYADGHCRRWCLGCGYELDPATLRRLPIPRGQFRAAKARAQEARCKPI